LQVKFFQMADLSSGLLTKGSVIRLVWEN